MNPSSESATPPPASSLAPQKKQAGGGSGWQPKLTMGQDRPAEICQIDPRDWEEHEITHNTPARAYGIGSIMRRYARLPEDFPVQVSVEHCIPFKKDRVNPWEADAGFRTILAVDKHRAALYEKSGIPRGFPMGFAMQYAVRLYERLYGKLPAPQQRRGTLVFPHKSSPVMKGRIFDHTPFIQWMDALPEECQPVYVCMYWKDYLKGDAKAYEDAGYPVLSAGYWLNENFFLRFVEMCSQFKYACANSFSGSFAQTVLCGSQFIYVNTGGHIEQAPDGTSIVHETDPTLHDNPYGKTAQPITTYPPVPGHLAKQQALIRSLSGGAHVRTPWRIAWVLRSEAKYQAKLRGTGLDFSQGGLKWKDIRPWQTQGIEQDGWTHTRVSLIVPAWKTSATLTLEFEMPGWSDVQKQKVQVRAPGVKKTNLKLRPGRHSIRVPLLPSREDVKVELDFEDQFPLPGESRTVTCRLLSFVIKAGAQDEAVIRLESAEGV